MAAQAEIGGKRLINHSASKTQVKKSKAPNQPCVTGHTNKRSLANYKEGDENEQWLIFSIIRSGKQVQPTPSYSKCVLPLRWKTC